MKKIFTFLLCAAILCSVAISLYGETVTSLPSVSSQDLSVKYTNNSAGISVSVSQGEAEGQLPDGTDFSAENIPNAAASLRIHPVQKTEQEAYGWIESSLGEKIQVLVPYHISFTDKNGKDISNQGIKITLEVPKNVNETCVVYALESSGETKLLTASYKNSQVSFTANGASFYVICTAAENPGTSDLFILPYMALLVVAGCNAMLILRKKFVNSHS